MTGRAAEDLRSSLRDHRQVDGTAELERPAEARAGLALAIAAAVDEVPAVRRTSRGAAGSVPVETLHRGGQVEGVRITASRASIRLVARALPLGPAVEAVRARVAAALGAGDARPIDVEVVDLEPPIGLVLGLALERQPAELRPRRAS